MRPTLSARLVRAHRFVLTITLAVLPGTIRAADSVEEFARILRSAPDVENKDKVAAHLKLVERGAAALVRPGDLRRALLLGELQQGSGPPQPGVPQEEENPFGKTYQKVRNDLAQRLKTSLRSSLTSDNPERRLAAVIFLSEMANDESKDEQPRQEPGPKQAGALTRFTPSMAADLRELLGKDKQHDVCAAAARAVATIDPRSAATLDALKPLLDPKRKVAERRAAAEGLGRMFHHLANRWQVGPGGAAWLDRIGPGIVAAAGPGLNDEDATVRRLSLEVIQQAGHALENSHGVFRSLARAVNTQAKGVADRLADTDLAVCLSAHQTLEKIAAARRLLRGTTPHPAGEVPLNEPEKPAEERALLDGILEAVPKLAKSLAHKEVRVRLASLYVLETLDEGAAPAVETVAKALKDENGFVRWGAARVLNNMAPAESAKAVPALAEALTDANKTVRLTAVYALERYGPQAAPAVTALSKALSDAEPRMRRGAVNALASIGARARPAVGELVKALSDKSAEVRAAAAAALGRLGGLDADTVKALHAALRDPEAAVRQAASDTLLDNPR